MVGGRAKRVGGEGNPEKAVCRTHEHTVCHPIFAETKIGDPGAKDLSVALANCPNLHTLDLCGQ